MRQKSDTVARFEQFLAEEGLAGILSAVEKWYVRTKGGKIKEILQNSVGGTTSARSSLPLIVQTR